MDRPLQQRLWGAAVLIALAVIFLPMLLRPPAPRSGAESVPLDVPNEPRERNVHELPLDAPEVRTGAVTAMPAPMDDGVRAPGPNPANAAPAAAPSAMPTGDYVVEFGTWKSQADAVSIVSALTAQGLHAFSEATGIPGQLRVRIGPFATREAAELARLSAGKLDTPVKARVVALTAAPQAAAPVAASTTPASERSAPAPEEVPTPSSATAATRTEAPSAAPTAVRTPASPAPASARSQPAVENTAAKPANATKPAVAHHAADTAGTSTRPSTLPKPAPKPAAAPAPAAPRTPEPAPARKPAAASTGYAVQLGAFADAAQAKALRDRARAAGLSAVTETIHTDKGTLTRVRLGPVVGRDSAEALRAQAAGRLGVSGIVRSSP